MTQPGQATAASVVSAPGSTADGSTAGDGVGFVERLMTQVRPEFRLDVIAIDDSSFRPGTPRCVVRGCVQFVNHTTTLCPGHYQRWRRAGRPDVDAWALTQAALTGRRRLASCRVAECRSGRGGGAGLCGAHGRQWARQGRPDIDRWITTATTNVKAQASKAVCRLSYCDLIVYGNGAFCHAHKTRWEGQGRPDVESFVAMAETRGSQRIVLGQLPPRLRLEIQYALQCQVDAGRYQLGNRLNALFRWLAANQVHSVLDHTEEEWHTRLATEPVNPYGKAFIRFAVHHLGLLRTGGGWQPEYDRDIWDLRRIGLPSGTSMGRRLRFDRIDPAWLRALAKRYVKWRISAEMSGGQVTRYLRAVELLAESLRNSGAGSITEAEFSREHIEQFLAHMHGTVLQPRTRKQLIGCIGTILTDARRLGWCPDLTATAVIYREDYPTQPKRLPRSVSEDVMRQVESDENMRRWPTVADRLIARILISCGRRVGEAVSLRSDCLLRDSATGEPYLRYWNQKMRREAHCPIDEDLADELEAHLADLRTRWPTGRIALFPTPRANPDGTRHLSAGVFRTHLYQWLDDCGVIDPTTGEPARFTPHQWRHTFAIRLVDADVPLAVIARLLDHDSLEMTSHYARVSDSKARADWERARKVNAQGQRVALDPGEDLADASFLAHRVRQSRHALPNGYCRLAAHKSCEHVNPCLSCALFITTPDFLPEHLKHRTAIAEHLQLNIEAKRTRQAEKDAQDLARVDAIITALQEPDAVAATGIAHITTGETP